MQDAVIEWSFGSQTSLSWRLSRSVIASVGLACAGFAPCPTWSRRDQLIATLVPLAGLVALFFGLVATLRVVAGCPGHVPALHAPAGCTTKGFTLPLGVAILLVAAGLAAHLLPPIHLMRTRRQQRSTFA